MEETKYRVVILIDALDEALLLDNVDWLPVHLPENVKIILTVTSDATDINSGLENDALLQKLKNSISKTNFLHLRHFSDQQWADMLSYGGGDFLASHGVCQLPIAWKQCGEKIPLQAKVSLMKAWRTIGMEAHGTPLSQVFGWFAWLEEVNLDDISSTSACNKIFEILEKKFGKDVVQFIMSLIIASRNGLPESLIIDLLKSSKLVNGKS